MIWHGYCVMGTRLVLVVGACCGAMYGCCLWQDDGTTPLWIASQNGHDDVARTLLTSGAKVNQAVTVSV